MEGTQGIILENTSLAPDSAKSAALTELDSPATTHDSSANKEEQRDENVNQGDSQQEEKTKDQKKVQDVQDELDDLTEEKSAKDSDALTNLEEQIKQDQAAEKNQKEKKKLRVVIDTTTQFIRTMAIIAKMFELYIFNSKNGTYRYSGKELKLTDDPAPKTDNDVTEQLGFKDHSWEQAVEQIEKIEELSFSQLMITSLDIINQAVPYTVEKDTEEKTQRKKGEKLVSKPTKALPRPIKRQFRLAA